MEEHQQKTIEAIEKTVNSSVKEITQKVIDRTPVGDPSLWKYPAPKDYHPGTLKASWEINTTNSARDVVTGRFKKQNLTTGNENSAQQWQGIKLNLNTTPKVTITNRQPYAYRVEYGWSTQAPAGMLRITLQEYSNIVDAKARENKV